MSLPRASLGAKPGSAVIDKPCAFLEEMEHSADKGQRWPQFADDELDWSGNVEEPTREV